jgi:predicted Holliday junction resolvase-like endonuclease
MRANVGTIFVQFGEILGICPCCGDIFRLSDARPFVENKRLRTPMDDIEAERRRIERAEDLLCEQEEGLRDKARAAGRRQAKKRLKQIDPIFSGAGLDPQDVKTIFDPVEYVVFQGMNGDEIKRVLFVAHIAESKASERIQNSLQKTIARGNIDFKTLQIKHDGALHLKS